MSVFSCGRFLQLARQWSNLPKVSFFDALCSRLIDHDCSRLFSGGQKSDMIANLTHDKNFNLVCEDGGKP